MAVQEVTEGVFRVMGKRSNIYLLGGDRLVLVDTGMPGDDALILDAIREAGYEPPALQTILITHAHLDHVGSLAAIKAATGARVAASRVEQDHVEGRRMLCSMNREGLGGKVFRLMLFVLENFVLKYSPAAVEIPCGETGGESVAGLRVVPSPGHSPGSISFYHEEKKILFAGDALSGDPKLRLPPRAGCSDYARALHSVRQLAGCDARVCLFGHGDPLAGDAASRIGKLL